MYVVARDRTRDTPPPRSPKRTLYQLTYRGWYMIFTFLSQTTDYF